MNSIKILVVEDEDKILSIIQLYLDKEGYQVIACKDGNLALTLFYDENPDLIILDLMLPSRSGEAICREIRKTSLVPIIMLTAKVKEEEILSGFDVGADDYVTKPFSPKQLIARVKAVLKRGVLKDVEILQFNNELTIDPSKHEVRLNHLLIDFTPIEFNILLLLARHPQVVFSRNDIINYIYEDEFDGYDRAIDSHIKNIRKKLGDTPPKYIRTVFGVGYKFGGE